MIGYIGTFENGELVAEERFDDFEIGADSGWSAVFDYVYNCTKREAPFQSWVFNKRIGKWEAPTPMPADAGTGEPPKSYVWDEETTNWKVSE